MPSVSNSAQANISIANPCDNPFSLTVGSVTNVQSDYSTPAIWTFPTINVDPTVCISNAVFSCDYKNGPYSTSGPLDFCSDFVDTNGDFSSSATFDETSGSLTFQTNDKGKFPPGVYEFDITVTIGAKQVIVGFTLSLTDPCPGATLTIVNNPFALANIQYVLHESANEFVFDNNSLVSSSTSVDCGPQVLTFLTDTNAAPDSELFTHD